MIFLCIGKCYQKYFIAIYFNFRASSADMAAAAKGNEPDERNIMDGGDDWGSHP